MSRDVALHRRLGWLVVAALTSAAHAETPGPVTHPAGGLRVPPSTGPVMHPTEPSPRPAASETRPKLVAAVVAPAPAADLRDPRNLRALTDDPAVGKADRIDGDEHKGVVAFTFDDGPNPETTPAVIDALEKYDVPATFFIVTQRITGKHGDKGRDILQRELAAGFLVGSHSVSHPNLRRAGGDQLTREIDASIRALAGQANRPIGMFRPPYGALGAGGRVRLKKLGLTEVQWSVDTLDWKAHDPERLRRKVISMIKHDGGGVVLMHDVKPITAKIIGEVLDDLEAENCARLATGKEPILPVSLHYFLRDGKAPRTVPPAVIQRTEAYRAALPGRCAKRPPAPEPAARPPVPSSAARSPAPEPAMHHVARPPVPSSAARPQAREPAMHHVARPPAPSSAARPRAPEPTARPLAPGSAPRPPASEPAARPRAPEPTARPPAPDPAAQHVAR